ncbi:hypothetical protein POM88_003233 [Heracleum sosnowskyi]|uniref:RING-type domain-containing protein n=1 Tax=Heracleum sosnowskyi TaxID=360622 RepID=A0AAD8JH34_9APIA|nr:hypothetical protein POM88_003233 [Heracleum sosnowskyi]
MDWCTLSILFCIYNLQFTIYNLQLPPIAHRPSPIATQHSLEEPHSILFSSKDFNLFMARDYYTHADPCLPTYHQYRYSQTHTFRHKATIFVRQLLPGRVPHAYYSKRYKPSPSRYTEDDSNQPRVHAPSVYHSNNRRPFGSLCNFDRPSSFHTEFKRRGSKCGQAQSQQTRTSQNGLSERYVRNRNGNFLQHGSLASSKNQSHGQSRKFSSDVRRNESASRFNSGYDVYPRYQASLDQSITPNRMYPRDGFLVPPEPHHRRRRPNRTGPRFSSGYDEYPRYWASLDERITPNGMYPRDGFLVSPEPHQRGRRPNRTASRFNSGYDEYPRYWASPDIKKTSDCQFLPNKSTNLKNNYKPPRRSRRYKTAMNRKKQTTSRRGQIAEKSDTSTDSEPESPTEYTEPIYHIKWDGDNSKECKHLEQICPICENDLSYISAGDYSYYEDDNEPPKLPEVAVLPCGHAFHSECLMQFIEEEQSREPPCFFCTSNESC